MATPASSPVLAQMMLARLLRQHRQAAGISSAAATGAELGWSGTKISRWEEGHLQRPYARDIDRLLAYYKASDAVRTEAAELVAHCRAPGWWREYDDVTPEVYRTVIGLESAAFNLRQYEPLLVPELLTTAEYGRAAIAGRHWHAGPDHVARLGDVRTRRQQRLFADDDPLVLWVIIEETALRRPVAAPDVMRGQYKHLLTVMDLPNVHLQVLRADLGAHAAVAPFSAYDFAARVADVAFVPSPSGGEVIDRPDAVAKFRAVFEALIPKASPVRASRALIGDLLAKA